VNILGLETNYNVVPGNYIGTDVNGTADLGNSGCGVRIDGGAQFNIIGGDTTGSRNIISKNGASGVTIDGSADNEVLGNFIGTDVSGTANLGNTDDGVNIHGGAQSNIIGGTGSEEGNIIAFNGSNGVTIWDSGTNGNIILGNYIGTDVSRTVDMGNTLSGAEIYDGAQSNIIGGVGPGEENAIAFNGGNGVQVYGTNTDYNKISGNSMRYSAGSGIDLVNDGNDEIPAPIITLASLTGNILHVEGTGAGANAMVEIFEADSTMSGEGETYLESLTADGSGNFSGDIDVTGQGFAVADPVVATTTHTNNNTSEFSTPVLASPMPDFGDNPDTYQTLFASGGPYHQNFNYEWLGPDVDGENDGQPSPNSDQDNFDDGITFLAT